MQVSVETRRTSREAPWTYAALDQRQREIARALAADGPGVLLLSEVEPVVTLGRRTPASDLVAPGAATVCVDRGGLATYHGPGQWVLFPVDRLQSLVGDPRGVRKVVDQLLQLALNVCRLYEPEAEVRSGAETGVWCARGKLAAVGIHIQQGVLLHGLAVNGYRTPESFSGIRPCGLEPQVAFLLDAIPFERREQEFQRLGEQLIEQAFQRLWPRS